MTEFFKKLYQAGDFWGGFAAMLVAAWEIIAGCRFICGENGKNGFLFNRAFGMAINERDICLLLVQTKHS